MNYKCPCCDAPKLFGRIYRTTIWSMNLINHTYSDSCRYCKSTYMTEFITEDKKTYTKVKFYDIKNNSKAIAQV